MAGTPKTYVPGASAKAKTFDNGNTIINLGLKVADLLAFANQHQTASGYLNLTLSPRREPGRYGETHSLYLDDRPRQTRSEDEEPPF